MFILVLYALILGVVEGITEFLPVSSTGHLIVLGVILNFEGPAGKMFEISIQLGAILAVVWLYRAKLIDMARSLLTDKNTQQFTLNLFLAFLPAAIFGLLFHHFITEHLFNIWVVATTMILGGFAIIAIEKWKPAPRTYSLDEVTHKRALLIGLCQTLAMIPGVSRSGATILGAIWMGVERKTATEFSFFLAIPTMFAATIFDIFKHRQDLTSDGAELIAVGFVAAFFSALLVVKWFVNFIGRHGLVPFACYRIIVGSAIIAVMTICHYY